jgi:hypothetical protein
LDKLRFEYADALVNTVNGLQETWKLDIQPRLLDYPDGFAELGYHHELILIHRKADEINEKNDD